MTTVVEHLRTCADPDLTTYSTDRRRVTSCRSCGAWSSSPRPTDREART